MIINDVRGFDREIYFEIIKQLGVISTHPTGWNKELNIVSWNGGQPKYDIRDWGLDHKHYSRGITLRESEAAELLKLLAGELINHAQFDELGISKADLLGFLGGQDVLCGTKSKG